MKENVVNYIFKYLNYSLLEIYWQNNFFWKMMFCGTQKSFVWIILDLMNFHPKPLPGVLLGQSQTAGEDPTVQKRNQH